MVKYGNIYYIERRRVVKKVRINKKYGEWYYKKEISYDVEFPIYHFWNNNGECYTVAVYSQMLECCKEPTKEAREQYIRIYG